MTPAAPAHALLGAAEAQFAESGIEEASLRAIMRAAGADAGSIHYHFRTREALAESVLDRILDPLNARRLELLAALEKTAAGRPIALAALVEALIRPDVELARDLEARSAGRARLIGAIYVRPSDFVRARVEDRFRPVARAFLPHLTDALSQVPAELISWRVRWCVFGTLGALMSDAREPFAIQPDALVSRVVAASAGALAAPISNV